MRYTYDLSHCRRRGSNSQMLRKVCSMSGECSNESDLDSCDRNAADGVTPLAFQVRLGVLQAFQVPSFEPVHI